MSKPMPDLPDLLPGFADRLEARAEQVAARHRAIDSGDATSTPSSASRRRWRLIGGGTLVAVVAVSGAYATGLWRPQLGSNPADPPAASARPVAPELLHQLAVLRRPQTEADRGAAATAALRFPATRRTGIQTGAVRTVGLAGGGTAVLVPMIDQASGAQELCLAVLAADQTDARACATTAEVADGRLLVATSGPFAASAEAERTARRRDAQRAQGDTDGGVRQPPSTGGTARVVGVAPDGVRAAWVGEAGPATTADNVFDLGATGVPANLRARWDN